MLIGVMTCPSVVTAPGFLINWANLQGGVTLSDFAIKLKDRSWWGWLTSFVFRRGFGHKFKLVFGDRLKNSTILPPSDLLMTFTSDKGDPFSQLQNDPISNCSSFFFNVLTQILWEAEAAKLGRGDDVSGLPRYLKSLTKAAPKLLYCYRMEITSSFQP